MSMPNYRDYWGPAGHAAYDRIQAEIEANRCPCGGSYGGNHLVSWHEEHGWDEAIRREEELDERARVNRGLPSL